MRQPCFCNPLVMLISITFPMHQILSFLSFFLMLPDFFHFILFFFINNVWRWYWFHMLTFVIWFFASCQHVFIEHVMYYPFFWKFELKHPLTNHLQDFKRSISFLVQCHIQVHLSGNNVPVVKPPLNHTSPPSTAATFLATHLMAVLQSSRYSVFHGRDTPIQLSLP